MYAKHKKQSWVSPNKIYLCILFIVVLLFLMIPAVSFANNLAEGQAENPSVESNINNKATESLLPNPIVEHSNINNINEGADYLCISPHYPGEEVTISMMKAQSGYEEEFNRNIKYSFDRNEWTELSFSTEIGGYSYWEIKTSVPVYFKGNNPDGFNIGKIVTEGDEKNFISQAVYAFQFSQGYVDASGSVMSLIYEDDTSNITIPNDGCFSHLFGANEYLLTPPLLPATNLRDGCYAHMFHECGSLNSTPNLPATVLQKFCYQAMFMECDSITSGGFLPALNLVEGCYKEMFSMAYNLSEIRVGFNSWNDAVNATSDWFFVVKDVNTSCFYCSNLLPDDIRDESHILSKWNVVTEATCYATTTNWINTYDTVEHTIGVYDVYPEDATVEYSLDGESFSSDQPKISDVGILQVFVKVSKDSFLDYQTSAWVVISPLVGSSVSVGSKTKYYGEVDPNFDITFTGLGDVEPKLGHDYIINREPGEIVKPSGQYYAVNVYFISNNIQIENITPGSLTINKANNLKLIADPASKSASQTEDPDFTAHMEGLKFNDALGPNDYRIVKSSTENDSYTLTPELTDSGKLNFGNNYDINVTGFSVPAVFTVYPEAEAKSIKYKAVGINVDYDAQEHVFEIINVEPSSAVVQYSLDQTYWSTTKIGFKNADGPINVYYKITAPDYPDVLGRETVTINKAKATLVANISTCFKNVGDEDPELSATLYGAVGGESLVKDTDYYISRTAGEDAGSYDISLSAVSETDKTKNYQIQVAPSKFFILGSGDVPPVPPTPPTPPTPDDPGTNPSFVNSIIAQTGDDNLAIVISLIVVACACGGFITYRKLRKK